MRFLMRSPSFKLIAVITLAAFLFSGCAYLMPKEEIGVTRPDLSLSTYAPPVRVVVEEKKPFVQQPLKKGQIAPFDGIIFDKESAKRLLVEITEGRSCNVKEQINGQLIAAYEEQRGLLRESNDLMAKSNEQYRKEIESQRRWGFLKNVLAVLAVIVGITLGIYSGK